MKSSDSLTVGSFAGARRHLKFGNHQPEAVRIKSPMEWRLLVWNEVHTLFAISHRRKIIFATVALGLAWSVGVGVGVRALLRYENTPGSSGSVGTAWPSGSAIHRANDRPTLVLFAHPRCPCTRATIGELAELMAREQGKLTAYVVFFEPPDSDAKWTDSDLQHSAAAIPGVQVLADVSGREARLFKTETSGHALLFAPAGGVLFSGGITGSRGHAGDNAGESAIMSIVNGHGAPLHKTFIFGCSLASAKSALSR